MSATINAAHSASIRAAAGETAANARLAAKQVRRWCCGRKKTATGRSPYDNNTDLKNRERRIKPSRPCFSG